MLNELCTRLASQAAMLVRIESTQGSVPRGVGAWMAVFADGVLGTIGGGHVEFQAINDARQRLAGVPGDNTLRYTLGPSLGQCCGGVVWLTFERVTAADIPALQDRLATPRAPVALFGGGHVGKAMVKVLGLLPFSVMWIDSRDEIFPADVPANVRCEHSDPVQTAVKDLVPGSHVLVMSFSHAEDLDIVATCLARLRQHDDLPYIGLIGSTTKWATFRHRLQERGFTAAELERVTCPIGLAGIHRKEPEVIAISVAAQLLQIETPSQPQPQSVGVRAHLLRKVV